MAADIHALEIEFAKNPTLEACIPLCEAYMAQKRFMEAMVVCKKGIKQAPRDARGRVLLARVYGAQGKAPKALAELEQLVQEMPGDPIALEALGRLLLEHGRRDEGVARLQQALQADPGRADARALLQQAGAAAPPVAPVVLAAPQMRPPGLQMPTPGIPAPAAASAAPGAYPPPVLGHARGPALQMPPHAPSVFPGQAPAQRPGVPPAPMGGVAPQPDNRTPMEHVHDFFAPETLGFTNEPTDIETAGPGRLTILGFVPKSTGSIKTTLFIALAVLAVAGMVVVYEYRSSVETREINKRYGELKAAMDEDKYGRYQDALRKGNEILSIDNDHNLTLGAMAYASAVIGVEFRNSEALARAKDYLRRAMAGSKEETEYRVAARALIAYADRQFEQGLVEIKRILDRGGSSPLVELEAFRLAAEVKPGDKDTQTQLRRLVQSVTSQARVYNFLGWYYYMQDDWAQADKSFASALQNVRGHPRALLGQAMTDFDRGIAIQERQREIATALKSVLSLPPEDLDDSVIALARFASGQLYQWQGKEPEAAAEFAAAFKLESQSPLMLYRRGTGLLSIGRAGDAVDFLRRAAALQPNNIFYFRSLADAQIRAGDTAGARATLDRAAQLNPADAELKVLEGDRLRADRKWAQAVDAYKRVTREDGGPVFARAAIGVSAAMRESGKKQEAVKYVEDFLTNAPADVMQPDQAKLWCELGLDYEAVKNRDMAEKNFSTGIDTYRYEPSCHYYACRLLGRGEDAKEACKSYLALAPRGEFAEDAKRRAGMK